MGLVKAGMEKIKADEAKGEWNNVQTGLGSSAEGAHVVRAQQNESDEEGDGMEDDDINISPQAEQDTSKTEHAEHDDELENAHSAGYFFNVLLRVIPLQGQTSDFFERSPQAILEILREKELVCSPQVSHKTRDYVNIVSALRFDRYSTYFNILACMRPSYLIIKARIRTFWQA